MPSLQPDEYQELREDIGDLSNLTTDDKSNLVAAINELDGKIGEGATGNVSSEQIDRIVVLDLEEFESLPEKAERTLYAIKG